MLLAMGHSLLQGGPMCEITESSQQLYAIGSVINVILQVRRLKHREVT